jgi:hypothetical protein
MNTLALIVITIATTVFLLATVYKIAKALILKIS